MIDGVTCELEAEIALHRSADIRGTTGVNAPAAIFVLMLEYPVRGFPEALLIARAEQRVQQDVIGFEGGIGFQLAAPVAIFVLREKRDF